MGNGFNVYRSDPYADADLELLMDNNSESAWITTPLASIRYYELQMELLTATEIRGIKIAQPYYGQWGGNTRVGEFHAYHDFRADICGRDYLEGCDLF